MCTRKIDKGDTNDGETNTSPKIKISKPGVKITKLKVNILPQADGSRKYSFEINAEGYEPVVDNDVVLSSRFAYLLNAAYVSVKGTQYNAVLTFGDGKNQANKSRMRYQIWSFINDKVSPVINKNELISLTDLFVGKTIKLKVAGDNIIVPDDASLDKLQNATNLNKQEQLFLHHFINMMNE